MSDGSFRDRLRSADDAARLVRDRDEIYLPLAPAQPAGLLAALAVSRILRSMLFGVTTTDPVTFIVIPLLLLAVTALACWVPARRAARLDPIVALRTD